MTSKSDLQKRIGTGQALLLDADLVPVSMQIYPGNESEQPYVRKVIEEMKQRHNVSGKTTQMVDKDSNFSTYKNIVKDELGVCAKYLEIITKDSAVKTIIDLSKSKIDEDLKYAGYYLLVASDIDMKTLQVYKTYHSLWNIE